jgi:soluble lytic murein transglycosylase-like protein
MKKRLMLRDLTELAWQSWRWRRPVRSAFLIWILLVAVPSAGLAQLPPAEINLKALFAAVGRMHNIDADLLEAMAEVESGGDPQSVSPKGALGLMQLMPGTASEFSVADPFDPVSSVLGAAKFLDYLRSRIGKSLDLQGLPDLLAAYNAGPKAVEKYGGVPPYQETRHYVQRVLTRYTDAIAARGPAAVQSIRWAAGSGTDRERVVLLNAGDRDQSLLNQLTAIRNARRQFVARMGVDGETAAPRPRRQP